MLIGAAPRHCSIAQICSPEFARLLKVSVAATHHARGGYHSAPAGFRGGVKRFRKTSTIFVSSETQPDRDTRSQDCKKNNHFSHLVRRRTGARPRHALRNCEAHRGTDMVSAHATVGRGDAGTGNADALGTVRHRLTVDGGERVLDVRSDLLRVRPFEFALRERIARLASFRHPAFVHVRRVERIPGSPATLSVVSDAARGVSLQAVIAFAAARRSPVRREWAIDCVRQLVDAIVALHAVGSDVGHGVLTADRIVVDPASKLSICDYVFGPALEHLRYPADQVPGATCACRFKPTAPPSINLSTSIKSASSRSRC